MSSLLAIAMTKERQRTKETGVPTHSQAQAASLTLSACNTDETSIPELYVQNFCVALYVSDLAVWLYYKHPTFPDVI
jgi:hypothetical protein